MHLFSLMQSKVDPYCFIEFYDHRTAEQAIKTMNKEFAFGKVGRTPQLGGSGGVLQSLHDVHLTEP